MSKIIIENRSTFSDQEAIACVVAVMNGGRVSNYGKQYCYYSVFNRGLGVASFLNKNSDRFVVTNEK